MRQAGAVVVILRAGEKGNHILGELGVEVGVGGGLYLK